MFPINRDIFCGPACYSAHAGQQLLLFQFAMSRGPCILVQCVALPTMFKDRAENGLWSCCSVAGKRPVFICNETDVTRKEVKTVCYKLV